VSQMRQTAPLTLLVPFPNLVIRADELGQAMVNVAIPKTEEHESRIFENHDIRGMVDSLRPSSG
jgi:hypothetical protein